MLIIAIALQDTLFKLLRLHCERNGCSD